MKYHIGTLIVKCGGSNKLMPWRQGKPLGQFLGKHITVRFVLIYVIGEAAHQAALKDITAAMESGLLHPVAVQRFSLDEILTAHEAAETGHTAGKVLIDVASGLV